MSIVAMITPRYSTCLFESTLQSGLGLKILFRAVRNILGQRETMVFRDTFCLVGRLRLAEGMLLVAQKFTHALQTQPRVVGVREFIGWSTSLQENLCLSYRP